MGGVKRVGKGGEEVERREGFNCPYPARTFRQMMY